MKTVDEHGFDALRAKKQPGRPPKLSPQQLSDIKDMLEEDDPKRHGFYVWDGPSLSAYIKETYAVALGVRQCQRLFHSLGFSLVRPQPFPSKDGGNEEERKAFKKN